MDLKSTSLKMMTWSPTWGQAGGVFTQWPSARRSDQAVGFSRDLNRNLTAAKFHKAGSVKYFIFYLVLYIFVIFSLETNTKSNDAI